MIACPVVHMCAYGCSLGVVSRLVAHVLLQCTAWRGRRGELGGGCCRRWAGIEEEGVDRRVGLFHMLDVGWNYYACLLLLHAGHSQIVFIGDGQRGLCGDGQCWWVVGWAANFCPAPHPHVRRARPGRVRRSGALPCAAATACATAWWAACWGRGRQGTGMCGGGGAGVQKLGESPTVDALDALVLS